jgi:signal transduction histidine kinase
VRNLSAQARIIGANAASAVTFNDPQAAGNTLTGLQSIEYVQSAGIVLPDNTMFAQFNRDRALEVVELPPIQDQAVEAFDFRGNGVVVDRKIILDGKWIATVYIRSNYITVQRRSQNYLLIAGGVLLLSMLAAFLFAIAFRRSVAGPIVQLADLARIVSEERSYAVRATGQSEFSEVAVLMEAFNKMLEQIQTRDQALRAAQSDLELKVEQRTRQLIAANRELEAFSYSVSHDLRNPLETINGFAYMLEVEYGAKLGAGKAYVEQLQAAARRMKELIEDMLKLSHVSSSAMHQERVNISEMVESILAELRRKDPQRVVNFKVAPELEAMADSRLLRIALENLLGNAWKYTSAHREANIEFGAQRLRGRWVYFVRDDGAGFDPSFLANLFKPFTRYHSLAEFPGTGIGLATVQRIIHRHGGEIWAESAVEKGATFYFSLGAAGSILPWPERENAAAQSMPSAGSQAPNRG